jgi:hypothetical protein
VRARTALLAVLVAVAAVARLGAASADDYTDPDYAAYDLDNMGRTTQRQAGELTSPEYGMASFSTFSETWLDGMARQAGDLPDSRLYLTLGQLLPGGNVGDPERYHQGRRFEVEFLNREGTKLVGNIWPCALAPDGTQPACPGVVVTTGSIQVTQHMYGWLARWLQDHGYTVMTFDVRGQGESETTTHEPDDVFANPENPQDQRNFEDGTVDALRFLLSSPAAPYVPVGWDAERRAAADATVNADDLEWWNPIPAALDEGRLALVGHSLGASAVSAVQQCSDAYPDRVLPDDQLPEACAGQRFPIWAIVAYDGLSSSPRPVVPAFDHRADGYFVNATPTFRPPDPEERTGPDSPFGRWVAAGVDTCSMTVRGGTHSEWSEIPYIVGATRYGAAQSAYYTQAWLDRFVAIDRAGAGFAALVAGPVPAEPPGTHLPPRASLLSAKYRSACAVAAPDGGVPFAEADLRAYAGVAAVGDWAAVNAEREGI